MTLVQAILMVVLTASIVVGAGTKLAQSADVIAARTQLGGVWVGSVILAAVTSLPELTTDIAAIRLGAVDLAAGDLFGSTMANMLILALITLLPSGAELFRKATLDHALYASLGIVLTAMAAIFILVRSETSFLTVGGGPLVLLVVYALGSRVVFRHSRLARRALSTAEMSGAAHGPAVAAPPEDEAQVGRSIRAPVITFCLAAIAILLAAPAFARSAEVIATVTGVGSTFIGTWLVGMSTSLPELTTSLAAVRMRSYDLAVGNLFGSNAFNMALWIVLDIAHGPGAIFAAVSSVHAMTALVGVVLMGVGVAALVYRAQGRLTLVEPSSALIMLGYAGGLALVLSQSAR